MSNYLDYSQSFRGKNRKDYSLSNNDLCDDVSILPKLTRTRLLELTNRYPDHRYRQLTSVLKQRLRLKNVVLGSGSEDLIIRINTIIGKSKELYITHPCFYKVADTVPKFHKIYQSYELDTCLSDGEHFSRQIPKKAEFVWLANPNPMIGKYYTRDHLLDTFKRHPNTLFIIDESAIDFVQEISNISVIDAARKFRNLIVIRSFSKLYGLAGLRVGFATGNKTLLQKVNNIGLTFPLNGVADYFATYVLQNQRVFTVLRSQIHKHKIMAEGTITRDKNIVISQSSTNCLFCGHKRYNIVNKLLRQGIISLPLNGIPGVKEKNFARITIHSSKRAFNYLYQALLRLSESE